ncbi:MAG: hypothetical protein FJZ88_01145 [Chloroflexi bacterium]|nr:hypothetical protein [Chloroflexota bacterium]
MDLRAAIFGIDSRDTFLILKRIRIESHNAWRKKAHLINLTPKYFAFWTGFGGDRTGISGCADRAKHQAAKRWVSAVNNWGQMGQWTFHVCKDPQMLGREWEWLKETL